MTSMAMMPSQKAAPVEQQLHDQNVEHNIHSHSNCDHDIHTQEINPLIQDDPKYNVNNNGEYVRPLSPTPVDSMLSDGHGSHSLIKPLKGSSWLFLNTNHPTQTFTAKQLCDYIEMMVLRHVRQYHNYKITPTIPLQPVKDTLTTLRSLLMTEIDNCNFTLQLIDDADGKTKENADTHTHGHKKKQLQKWATHSNRNLCDLRIRIPSPALLHHPSYSIDVDKYCGILRGSVRQDWNTIETEDDEERNWQELKPHWFELFFDLMFVAAIVHITSEVADVKYNQYMFIVTVFPQFGLLILCWLEQALYHSRFRMTQRGDNLLRFVYMAFVLMMGLSIGNFNTNYETTQQMFLIAYMFTKVIMCIMFVKSSFIPRARNHSLYMIVENVLSIVAVIFMQILFNFNKINIKENCLFIFSSLFIYSWFHMCVLIYLHCIRDLGINIPINVPHIAERMGAFILIILGESIISLMVQHIPINVAHVAVSYTVTMSFFVIVYCIGKLYFESQPSQHEIHHHQKSHALSTSVWRARIYKWFHILLFFGLLALGLGSKIMVHELPHYYADTATLKLVFMPGISCIVICICINIIRLTHPFDYSDKHPRLVIGVWILRVLCIIVMFAILFTWKMVNHVVILGVYVACFIVQILVDFEAKSRLIITKSADKDKSLHFYRSPRGTMHLNEKVFETDEKIDHECTLTTKESSFIGTF